MPRKLILLVEDEPMDQALTLRVLREHRARDEVVIARDGAEALALLHGVGRDGAGRDGAGRDGVDRGTALRPELVLLDLGLPQLGGLEVLRRIRAEPRTRWLPVIMLTSSDAEGDMRMSYELGANSYIQKPVNFDAYANAVRQASSYWLELNSLPPAPDSTL